MKPLPCSWRVEFDNKGKTTGWTLSLARFKDEGYEIYSGSCFNHHRRYVGFITANRYINPNYQKMSGILRTIILIWEDSTCKEILI